MATLKMFVFDCLICCHLRVILPISYNRPDDESVFLLK